MTDSAKKTANMQAVARMKLYRKKAKVGQAVAVAVDVQKQKQQQRDPSLRKCKTEPPTFLQTNATLPVDKGIERGSDFSMCQCNTR